MPNFRIRVESSTFLPLWKTCVNYLNELFQCGKSGKDNISSKKENRFNENNPKK